MKKSAIWVGIAVIVLGVAGVLTATVFANRTPSVSVDISNTPVPATVTPTVTPTEVPKETPTPTPTPTPTVTETPETTFVVLPNTIGMTREAADASIKMMSDKLLVVFEESYSSEQAGLVLNQIPQGGESVPDTETVTLTVSLGQHMVEIPYVYKMSLEEAEALLHEKGFVTSVEYEHSEKAKDLIYDASPRCYNTVEYGSEVVLYVSKGPAPTPTEIPMLTPEPNEILATAPYGENIVGTLTGDCTLTLSGTGATYDYTKGWNMPHNCDDYGLDVYKTRIQKIVIEEGITEINGYALAFIRNCRELVLPKSLVKIGKNAFEGLGMYGYWTDWKMSGVNKDENLFYTKTNLGESNVKEIAFMAFRNSTMEAIVLPQTLEVIGENAFYGCEWNFWYGRGRNPIVIPSSVRQIDDAAFNTGWYYVIKGKSSWDDFESIGESELPYENTHHHPFNSNTNVTFEP